MIRSSTSTIGILLRHAASRRSPAILLCVLVGIAVLIVALVPRALIAISDDELHSRLEAFSATQSALTVTGRFGLYSDGTTSADDLLDPTDRVLAAYPSTLDAPLGPALGQPDWFLVFDPERTTNRDPEAVVQSTISLVIDERFDERVRYVDGSPPSAWRGSLVDETPPVDRPALEIGISSEVAQLLELGVGDVLDYANGPLLVSGIWQPADPDDAYWQRAADLLHPTAATTLSGLRIGDAAAILDTGSAVALGPVIDRAKVDASFPLTGTPFSFAEATEIADQVRKATSLGLVLPSGSGLAVQSVLPYELARIQQGVTALTALLALALSAPLGMLCAVIALGVRSVIRSRSAAITLAAARGLSESRIRALLAAEGLAITVPATALALVVAGLMLPATTPSIVVPLLVGAAVPVVFAVMTSPRRLAMTRTDGGAAATGRTRLLVESATIGVTALAVFLLFRRGLLESGTSVGVDPLLAAVPLLLALSTCVVVLRVYPRLLMWLQRRVRRRPGPVGILGIARAVRDPALGFSSVLAIVIGVSAAVFSLMMASTVSVGLQAAARQQVGGDLRVVSTSGTLPPSIESAVRDLPGVAVATAVQEARGGEITRDGRPAGVTIVLADTRSLSIPQLAGGADAAVPFLQSSDVTSEPTDDLQLNDLPAQFAGVIDSSALPVASSAWVLVDAAYAERLTGAPFAPQQVLVTLAGGADESAIAAELERLAPGATVSAASALLDRAQSRPAIIALLAALLAGAILSFVLCAFTVVVSAVTAAESRARTVGVMRLLGMPAGRARALLGWELAPVTASAVLAGTVLGIALPFLLAAVVDLRTFTGGSIVVDPAIPLPLVAAATLGFAAFVAITGFIASASGSRADLASTARMGAE